MLIIYRSFKLVSYHFCMPCICVSATSENHPKWTPNTTLFLLLFRVAKLVTADDTDDAVRAHLISVGLTEYVPCMQCYGSSVQRNVSGNGWDPEITHNGKCQRKHKSILSQTIKSETNILICMRHMD